MISSIQNKRFLSTLKKNLNKIFRFLSILFIPLWCFLIFYYRASYHALFENIFHLFLFYIIPSTVISISTGILLENYSPFTSLLFRAFKKVLNKKDQKILSLFFLSFLLGAPSSILLLISSYTDKKISKEDATFLLPLISHPSYVFLLSILTKKEWFILLIEFLISFFLLLFKLKIKNARVDYKLSPSSSSFLFLYTKIITTIPNTLLLILSSMILVCVFYYPLSLTKVGKNLSFFIEVTQGITSLLKLSSIFKIIGLTILVSTSGLCILLQGIVFIKNSDLSINKYFFHLFIKVVLTLLSSLLFYYLL